MFAEGQGLPSPDPISAQIYFNEVTSSQHEAAKNQLKAFYARMLEKGMEEEEKAQKSATQ